MDRAALMSARRKPRRPAQPVLLAPPAVLLALPAFLAAWMLFGGAVLGQTEKLRQEIVDRGFDPEEITRPLRLSEEMRTWTRTAIPHGGPDLDRIKILFEKLSYSDDFDFRYQPGYTGTVEEVFTTGKFDCLSFSLLFVSLAREMGLPAFFLNLKQDQDFQKVGDLVVVSRHLTAGYGTLGERRVLEFDLGPDVNYQIAEPISDLDALALFYSNRGAELLRAGDVAAAVANVKISVELAPELAQAWVNLGVAQRRLNDLPAEEEAYFRAIELERGNLPAYQNLITLQRLRGEEDAAAEMIDRLDRRRNRNPFTFLTLGDLSLEDGHLDEGETFYRRAFRLARYEAETHAAMGQWALAAGRVDSARAWFRKAYEIDAHNPRTLELGGILISQERPRQPGGVLR